MPRAATFDVVKLGVLVECQICQAWLYKSSDIFTIMQRPDPSSTHYKGFVRFQEKLCNKIKRLREEHGYTQEDMTDFELSLRQYQRMEQDPTTIVSLWQIYKLAKAFKVSVDDLLDIDK